MSRTLVIGDTGIAARACRELTGEGRDVTHLLTPTDKDLRAALTQDVDAVVVLFHDDTLAIRYVLTIEHIRSGVAIWVAMFDHTAAEELHRVVKNLTVASPATLGLPSLLAGVMGGTAIAIKPPELTALTPAGDTYEMQAFHVPPAMRREGRIGRLRGQLRPYNNRSVIMMGGLIGLLCILVVDTLLLIFLVGREPLKALHEAVAVLATVGPAPEAVEHPAYEVFAIFAMLAAIILLAVFTAGVVDHLVAGRFVGIFGRRAMPRSGHVIVVGIGQVGLRLCEELRRLGIAVVGVERQSKTVNMIVARSLNIPVVVGDGASARTLRRVSVERSLAVVAVCSDELENIAAAVTARALAPDVQVVMRAGMNEAISETASLLTVGSVVDVDALTVTAVSAWCAGHKVDFLAKSPTGTAVVYTDGEVSTMRPPGGGQCAHRDPAGVAG